MRVTEYKLNRQGQQMAREAVSTYFDLPKGAVVHHEDADNMNNAIENLLVFASQSDHLKWHHGVNKVSPIWDGKEHRA